jgi:hypothetical protein
VRRIFPALFAMIDKKGRRARNMLHREPFGSLKYSFHGNFRRREDHLEGVIGARRFSHAPSVALQIVLRNRKIWNSKKFWPARGPSTISD